MRWIVGLALLLAGCVVKPLTPPAVVDVGQPASATATTDVTTALSFQATDQPAATLGANATVAPITGVPSTAPATIAVDATATDNATVSPTPVLIIVAEVALLPAPTATMPPSVVAVARPKQTAAPAVQMAAPIAGDVAAAEQYTVDLINAQRVALGLAALAADSTLMGIANSRVADMVTRGYTGHNDPVSGVALGPALMKAAGYGLVGENWYGTRLGPPTIADVAMKWFMTDAPHYQNILNPHYNGVGVGIAYNGQQWLLVQDFGGS
jgi:uncharacterized protein YkwD